MPDPQQFMPQPVREWLVAFIAEQTGVTNPINVFFAWMGFGEGIVSFHSDPADVGRNARRKRLKITGPDADALREVETGREPITRTEPWEDGERPMGARR